MPETERYFELSNIEKVIAKFPHFHVFDAKNLEINTIGSIAEYLANRFSDPYQQNVIFIFSAADEMSLLNKEPVPYMILDGGRRVDSEYLYIMVNKEYKNEISYLKIRFM